MANQKVYIHELVEIIGSNRAKYMHHMSAVWAAVRRDHQQLQLGVWAEVGTTGNWPLCLYCCRSSAAWSMSLARFS